MKTAVILQSGHNLASPDQLHRALTSHAERLEAVDAGSRIIGLTEQAAHKFDNALEEFADESGWHLYHPNPRGPRECAFLSSRPIRRRTYLLLTDKTLDPKVTNRSAPLFVDAIRPQGDDWFAIWHSPAHNEGLRRGNRATRVWLDAWHGMKRWRMGVSGRPTIMGDWNADPNRPRVLDVMTANFPRMKWAGEEDQRPTQGGRVIDGFLTRRRVVESARTLKRMDGFDHAPVFTVFG